MFFQKDFSVGSWSLSLINQTSKHHCFFVSGILGSIFHVMFRFCKIYKNWPKGLQNCFPELLASLFWGVKVSDHVHIIETIEVKNWWDTYHTYYKYHQLQFLSAFFLLMCGVLLAACLCSLEHFYFRYIRFSTLFISSKSHSGLVWVARNIYVGCVEEISENTIPCQHFKFQLCKTQLFYNLLILFS